MDAEKKLEGNCTRMPNAVLTKSWKQHHTKQQLYGHLLTISNYPSKMNKTCGVIVEKQGQTHKQCFSIDLYIWMHQCWLTSKNFYQLCVYTGHSLEDLLGAMDDRDGWREKVNKIYAVSMTWLLWWDKIKKTEILLSCNHVNTTVWWHNLDSNKTNREKAKWELYQDAACCFEQILEAASHITATVLPLTLHPKPFKHYWWSKNKRTHEWCTPMDYWIR